MPALLGGMKSSNGLTTKRVSGWSMIECSGGWTSNRHALLNEAQDSFIQTTLISTHQPLLYGPKASQPSPTHCENMELHMDIQLPAGTTTGHNLVSCIGELSLQDFDDLTQCTQIATCSADRLSSRFANSAVWLNEYVNTLDFLGWSVFNDAIFTRTQYDVSKSVADLLVQSAQAMPDRRQGNAMIDTLDALKPNKAANYSLDTESLQGERFQVIPTRYDAKGFLEIGVFNLELVANTKKSSFLFWNWAGHTTHIIQQCAYLKLDRRKLDTRRALIEKKLLSISMKRFDLAKTRNNA
ncbi:hypothetical protein [Pseudomonas sp. P8_241]|uniref:hypothetical protein n=2 Tax=unclassified Pseudomonas TaxID=196821 RepID=UPI002A371935|nr:hypothetical protein [Pseudomonas sp. P8_241]WPN47772.1 hypothetical protein QMK58_03560 [Pseudomonas sp. P8_241]